MAMHIHRGTEPLRADLRGAVIAIGNFDGLHRGHQALIDRARTQARLLRAPLGLVTFEPHPRSVFHPDEPLFRLSPLPLKERLCAALGLDLLAIVNFTAELAALSAEDFVTGLLVHRLGVGHVVTGYDFHFGRGRKGNPDLLHRLAPMGGFTVDTVEQVTDENGLTPFSSSTIRNELRQGRPEAAARQLGWRWQVTGTVVQGDQRGRTIGFPTANIILEPGTAPAEGIYAMQVHDRTTGLTHPAAGYVGKRPTFETERSFLEIFLFDFSADLYGHELDAIFTAFIRPDRKFDGVAALITQMEADCARAREILADLARHDPLRALPLAAAQADGSL
jgi:riboflavin kinase/FMN adenylyltransferase